MRNHEPPGYDCPFCRVAAGGETEHNRRSDVVWTGDGTTAFVSPRWWPGIDGNVIVVPDRHVENVYDADPALLGAVYATARRVALAMLEAYGCEGTSTRQHNGPGAGQDVWHLHVHVFPRRAGDGLYANDGRHRWATPEERAPLAAALRAALSR